MKNASASSAARGFNRWPSSRMRARSASSRPTMRLRCSRSAGVNTISAAVGSTVPQVTRVLLLVYVAIEGVGCDPGVLRVMLRELARDRHAAVLAPGAPDGHRQVRLALTRVVRQQKVEQV